MKLLIPGGAGYIGSHMAKYAQDAGHEVVVLDDFSSGNQWAINDCELINISLLDKEGLKRELNGRSFDGVIHFAAKSIVPESVLNPLLYYTNNVEGSFNLIGALLENNINNIVFSSTAAIFGNPLEKKISEDHPKNPINPYGKSKLMVENFLKDIYETKKISSTCLRYFNAAGAHESGEIGECHDPETHLIPVILKSILDPNTSLKVFGDDYNTHDGTCIRDYIHVYDLCHAHLLSLEKMIKNEGCYFYNLGNGNGFSVKEVIKSCEKVTKNNIRFEVIEKRSGDPDMLVSNSIRASKELNWHPKYNNLDEIIASAWNWHRKELPNKS